jgi:hypothetical protein
MRWLEAGATGSYGTAIEPCNFLQKFPNPVLAIWHYTRGSTLIESYWRSVQMPGQGNFVGEPLSRPFAGYQIKRVNGELRVYSPEFKLGSYRVWGESIGIEHNFGVQQINAERDYIVLQSPVLQHYRIERARLRRR